MLRSAVGSWAVAAWLLICDAGFVPERFALGSSALHWQVFVVLGTILVATRDRVSEIRCRCCGNSESLSWKALFKSREMLCDSCLTWDPGTAPEAGEQVSPEYADLFEALKH